MLRQTFYISEEVSQKLKIEAHKKKKKLSRLVDEALRSFLFSPKKEKKDDHSLLAYAGKFKSFKNTDPIEYQKSLRSEWKKK